MPFAGMHDQEAAFAQGGQDGRIGSMATRVRLMSPPMRSIKPPTPQKSVCMSITSRAVFSHRNVPS